MEFNPEVLLPGERDLENSLYLSSVPATHADAEQVAYAKQWTEDYRGRQVIKRWWLVYTAWQTHLKGRPNSTEANVAFVNQICYGPDFRATPRDLTERMDAFPVFYAPGDSMLPSSFLHRPRGTITGDIRCLELLIGDIDDYDEIKAALTPENMEVAMLVLYATYAAWCIYDQKLISAEQVNALEEEFPADRHQSTGTWQQTKHYCNARSVYEKRFVIYLLEKIKRHRPRNAFGEVYGIEDLSIRRDFRIPGDLSSLGKRQARVHYNAWFWQFFFYRLVAVTGKGVQFVRPLFYIAFGNLGGSDRTPFSDDARRENLVLKLLTVLTTSRESLPSAMEAVKTLYVSQWRSSYSQAFTRNPYVVDMHLWSKFDLVRRFTPWVANLHVGDSFMAMAILSDNATMALALASDPDYNPFWYNLGFSPDYKSEPRGISLYSDIGLLLRKRQRSNDPLWKEVLRQMIRSCDVVLPWGELHYPRGVMRTRAKEINTAVILHDLVSSEPAEVETPTLAAAHIRNITYHTDILSERSEHTSLWDMARQNTKPGYAPWKLQVLAEEGVVAVEKTPAAPMIYELARKELGRDTQAEEHKMPALENPRPGKRRRTGQHEEVGLVASGNASHPPKPYSIFPGFPSTQAMAELSRFYPYTEPFQPNEEDGDYAMAAFGDF